MRRRRQRGGAAASTGVFILVCLGATLVLAAGPRVASAVESRSSTDELDPERKKRLERYRERREALDRSVWAPEREAQRYEQVFIELWDSLRSSSDPLSRLTRFPVGAITFGLLKPERSLDLGIQVSRFSDPYTRAEPPQLEELAARLRGQGYELVQSEWHHLRFTPSAAGEDGTPSPATSTITMKLHLALRDGSHRAILRGELDIVWADEADERGRPVVREIDARRLRLLDRKGPAAFDALPGIHDRLAASLPPGRADVLPVLVYDLDDDGLSEIVTLGVNRVLRNEGGGKFRSEPLLQGDFHVQGSAILADFTGDGHADLVAPGVDGRLMIFEGSPSGRFPEPGEQCTETRFSYAKALTAGDIDRDGDLDLFVAQYKHPYHDGSMPTPFYDANDGHPASLLINDGAGRFVDETERAGLAAKRHRRTYSASFIDLDDDDDLDLLVVSDFSGLDVYVGDGKGRFKDVTRKFLDERNLFGMAHTFADYDLDGDLDIYAIGMSSTTARRLDHLGLAPGFGSDVTRMRRVMGYGNRMFLKKRRRYRQAPFNDSVARTGWSWGTTSFDFDNDGDRDIYVANGHSSGESAQDYCTTYWSHDVYSGTSEPDPVFRELFNEQLAAMGSGEISWNGYEKNSMFVNLAGREFVDASFLLGTALEKDSRAVVSDDLDGDGRVDIVVSEFAKGSRGRPNTTRLHVLQNRTDT
ncbi:MAG: VCBS repeat-containing protein, partial [Acidobacteriota bacterium]|nr:VCBS repeat-containing protein [Acidobacteriota bacterium]